jgi:outer membrane protein TolC
MKTAFYNRILIAIIIVTAASAEMRSQNLPDSLAGYLGIAAENNPAVQQKLFEYQAALQKVPQVGSLPDPQLNAGVFLKPMELMSGNQVADFQLMQMFPWFGVLRNAKDEMSLMANARYELFRDARAEVYYDVQRAWYELFRIRAGRRIAEKNISLLRTIERLTLVKYKSPSMGSNTQKQPGAGMSEVSQGGAPGSSSGMQNMNGKTPGRSIPVPASSATDMSSSSMGPSSGGSRLSDLYRVQIDILGLEDRIESLKTQERTLTAQMNSLLNRDPLSPVYVDTVLRTHSLPFPDEALRDSIMANNPMLTMLEYENQSLEAKKKMVEGMSYPMVGIGVSYSLINKSSMSTSFMNGDDMVMPMVSVTLPVYRKKYKAMKNEAQLLQTATEQAYLETVNSLTTEFYSALQMFQDASRKTRLYESQGKLASGSLDLILKDFSTSSSPLTDVLRMQQEVYEYELKLIEANADMNIAAAWITRLMASANK